MLKYTNQHDLSLALAVFLMYDSYDHDPRPNVISATAILRSLRQIILMIQNKSAEKEVDISDLISSRMGSAIHDGCELAWTDKENVANALRVLGASDTAIQRVKINPKQLGPNDVPVYVEQRAERALLNFIITGKFDLVLDGTLNDYKSTSVWTYIYDSNADNYTKQGSIYKWLNPTKITSDYINIHYIFTDWSASKARQDKSYPQQRALTKKYPLMTLEETESWLMQKLNQLEQMMHFSQDQLPDCSDEELWATDPVYKYFKNPAKREKSTKNFNSMDEALIRKSEDGDVGVIVTVPGEVKACRYCAVVNICSQAEKLLASGRLTL